MRTACNAVAHTPTGRIRRRGAALAALPLLLAALLVAAPALAAKAVKHAPPAAAPFGIKVVGNHLATLTGRRIRLLGVDRSGAEYMCTRPGDKTVFDGPTNARSIRAIKSWHTNAVRVPLNEDCWLGIDGAVPAVSGVHYRRAVRRYVKALNAAGLYVILDLHWAAPGRILASYQWPMADADHSPTFWRSVARTFKHNHAVIFDLFNEPFIGTWPCWEHGCATIFTYGGRNVTYASAGMQQLVDAVRSTGAATPLMLGGLEWASDERGWRAHEPHDPDHQLIVSFHTYDGSNCNNEDCWQRTIAPLAATTPVVTGEFGEMDCDDSYALSYMDWADTHGVSYLGWAWDSTDSSHWSCWAGPSLINDYSGGATPYGFGLMSHLASLAR
ncbi:MAG: cellulase family glycosylhydrolase [Solirubrobacteraceae bacterium]|jgi:hypothetical protein